VFESHPLRKTGGVAFWTSTSEARINLYEPGTVSREVFRIENAASVATENCLNEGVHLTSL
jgi:hypothetical protein